MHIAICSDIHGNRHAFEAVIAAAEAADAEELWCLGDLVGYGGDPDDCVRLAADHCTSCLAGNHDLAVIDVLSLSDFSRGAALAAQWTKETIQPETRDYLASLEPQGAVGSIGLYHASPRDPVWEYVLSTLTAELCLDATTYRVSMIGHSHVALAFTRPDGEPATGATRRAGEEADLSTGEWLVNPGSTGQPRGSPSRELADARHRRLDGHLAARGVRHRGRHGVHPRGSAARFAGGAPPTWSVRRIAPY